MSFSVLAQTRLITGKITDTSGAPLAGVSVVVKGTTIGTQTATDGTFKINAPSSAATLQISYVGYGSREVSVGNGNVSATLRATTGSLNDVVVIGYGSVRRRDATGSVATVNEKDFQQGTITTPEQLIAGKVSGVSITSNGGAPGSGSVIRIRGGTSLNASNDPLIIVDGVPLSDNGIAGAASPLSLINPNDIESFTILKDAASTAIYGSRASNGIIMITTKHGRNRKPTISFSTLFGVSQLPSEYPVLSPDQFRSFVTTNGTPAQIAMMGTANTDWQKEIYQTAISTDNNLSISGAVKNIPYRISGEFLNQDGILKTDNLERTSVAINLTPSLFDNHLKITLNLHGAITNTRFANQGAIGSALSFDPTQPVHDTTGAFGGYYEHTSGNDSTPLSLGTRNPVALLEQENNKSQVQRSFGNIQFDYKVNFLPDLHINLNLGYDAAQGSGTVVIPGYAAQGYNQFDSLRGSDNYYKQKYINRVGELYLNYVKDIKSIKSNINAIAGYGYYDNYSQNYAYPSFSAVHDTVPSSAPTYYYTPAEVTLISYYGRLIYTYNNKYILMGSIRTDGSSRFGPDYRWGVFPAGAFTWKINQENFLKNSATLSTLHLRLSYGVTGNQEGIGYYGYIPFYSLSQNVSKVNFGSNFYNFWSPSTYAGDLQWEQTQSADVGFDYGFLKNRITGSVDFYDKKTDHLIGTVYIPELTNFGNQVTRNVGNMNDKGIDFDINFTPIQNPKVRWDVGFNVSYNKFKITNLTVAQDSLSLLVNNAVGGISGGTGNTIQVNSIGYQPYTFYVLQQIYGTDGKPIEGLYVDQNRDGIINNNDLVHYKSPYPPYVFGFNTSLNYKNWSFSMVMRANVGNYMYNNVASSQAVTKNIINPLGFLSNAPSAVLNTNFYNNQFFSSYYIENASFLRMDNISIGYNCGHLVKNTLNLRITANCQNVFVITKYTGADPEIYGGIDNNFYPRPRIYSLGLNLDL